MNARRKDDDEDTDTGLPRKTVGKLFRMVGGLLVAVALWYLNDIRGDLKGLRAEVVELKIEVAALKAAKTVALVPSQIKQAQ